jgi:hypothetical protein
LGGKDKLLFFIECHFQPPTNKTCYADIATLGEGLR